MRREVAARAIPGAVAALIPLAGLVLLLARPALDGRWEHHPAHFWLVVGAAASSAVLAVSTAGAATRRADPRVLLVSLAFLAAAGFLGLHALATPGVLLPAPNVGFTLATPVGLLVAAVLVTVSTLDLGGGAGRRVVRSGGALRAGLVGLMALWAALSLLEVPPLRGAVPVDDVPTVLAVFAVAAVPLFLLAAVGYLRMAARRGASMLVPMAFAFVLLAEAMLAVALGRNWHATWWEWHLLMLAAFGLIAWSARRQWRQERFSQLYSAETAAGRRELTVLFADLKGFTTFSEAHDAATVRRMLNEYFERVIPPIVRRHGGDIDNIIGDALMVTFNRRGDQPDHAVRAARAALAMQEAMAGVAHEHPDWPRFRIGVNTGEAVVGLVGATGGRTHTVIGDAVNVASRIEGQAPVGGIALGGRTAQLLPAARTEPLGRVQVKGREEPVELHRLIALPE